MSFSSTHWTDWVRERHNDPKQAVQRWCDTLLAGQESEILKLPDVAPLDTQGHKEMRYILLGGAALNEEALEASMYLAPWPLDWMATWLREKNNEALEGRRLERALDWWMKTPFEATDEYVRLDALGLARRVLFKEIFDNGGKSHRQWELLARMTPYEPEWVHMHGSVGHWMGVMLDFSPHVAWVGHSLTTGYTEDELCLGLRISMNHPYGRDQLWGMSKPYPAANWKQWELWLDEDDTRKTAWARLREEDQQDTACARDWTAQWFPAGQWQDPSYTHSKTGQRLLNIRSLLDHPYFGGCAQHLDYTEEEHRDFHKTLLDCQKQGDHTIVDYHRKVAMWLARVADRRSQEGDGALGEAYASAPVGRRLPCPPDLMSMGVIANSQSILGLGMNTPSGTQALLRALEDERVARSFKLDPERLLAWASSQGDAVTDWRSPKGQNLLVVLLPESPKDIGPISNKGVNRANALLRSDSIAWGFAKLTPQWLTECDPTGRCLMDEPLASDVAMTEIRRWVLGKQLDASLAERGAGGISRKM